MLEVRNLSSAYGQSQVLFGNLISLPVGLWLGHIHRGSFMAINVGNIWRALPSLAVLATVGVGVRAGELGQGVLSRPAIPPQPPREPLDDAGVVVDRPERCPAVADSL